MAQLTKTKPGTRKLSEIARHLVIPDGIVTTGWPAVEARCANLGVAFDWWQKSLGQIITAKRSDGLYAAGIGGVVMSLPRQVGKTFLINSILFALCLQEPGMTVLWTAHHMKTTNETFGKVQAMARRSAVKPHVRQVYTGSNDEAVLFRNGSRILYGARAAGFGRGFDNVDAIMLDEAQILTDGTLDDMLPAMNAARNPMLFLVGTPPRPTDPSEVFERKRAECLSGDETDTAYIECSADRGADLDDHEQWALANPSYPHRTPTTSIMRMRKNLSDDSFRREALGIWDEIEAAAASEIESDQWDACAIDAAPAGRTVYGVKFSIDGKIVALAGARRNGQGPIHVEGIERRPTSEGTSWLVDWLVERADTATSIVVDGRSGAGALVRALAERRVPKRKTIVPTAEQAIAAHAMFTTAVTERAMTHAGDPLMAEQARSAGRRAIGNQGGWGFRSLDDSDISLLEAAVLAHYGSATAKEPSSRGRRMSLATSRRGGVL